jgi:hypothetical protein
LRFVGPYGRPAPPVLLPSPLAILAQADLEEDQQHRAAQPEGHHGDSEHLAEQAADERAAQRAGDRERGR